MKHYSRLLMLACSLGFASPLVMAASSDSGNSMPDRATVEAALDECAASASTDSNGQPDRAAMDSCMSGKGFTRPSGPPPGRGPGNGGPGNAPPGME